jgi:8-amino-7-oxononanoate synthase
LPPRGRGFRLERLSGPRRPPALAEAAHEALRRGVPVGSGGSRLLRGNHPEHEALEAEAAAFFGAESALFLPTGFTANSALLATLPQAGDAIFADELIHASAHEGFRLSRARRTLFAHNDAAACAAAIAHGARGQRHALDRGRSLYSMDGDTAPLAALPRWPRRKAPCWWWTRPMPPACSAPAGAGWWPHWARGERILSLHTLGKALGPKARCWRGGGAARFSGQPGARLHLFHRALAAGRRHCPRRPAPVRRGGRSARRSGRAHRAGGRLLAPLGAEAHGTPILPLVLGEDARAMAVAARCRRAASMCAASARPPCPRAPRGCAS